MTKQKEMIAKSNRSEHFRKCVGCNEYKPKNTLIRVVRVNDGTVAIDKTFKAQGRGAYVCPNDNCIKTALKRNSFSRSLHTFVDPIIFEELINDR